MGHRKIETTKNLLDRFLAEYPGPGGSEHHYYTLDSPVDVAVGAGRASTPGRPIAVSADVGPDLIVPWRRPSLVILYARHAIDPSDFGLTDAQGRHDANVIIRNPQDRSVFPVPALAGQVQGNEVPLADPLQQIWDLQDLGGGPGRGRWEATGMATGTPLTRIALGATSVADDLGYVALADLARALGGITDDYRVIGGHMVTVLAARWQLGHDLYRETGDVDLGIPPIVARDHNLVSRLKDLNYMQVAGNRFARGLPDIPAGTKERNGSGNPKLRKLPRQGEDWRSVTGRGWMG